MKKFTDINSLTSYLNAIPMFQSIGKDAVKYGLERIAEACDGLGNPQDSYDVVHVAGTNGKGAVCHMLASVFHKSGLKTGLFTSPHLISYNERIRINGQSVPNELLLSFFNENSSLIEELKLSYFEVSTLAAFEIFRQQNVQLAVIETGLGGRLDATNIVHPKVSIITSIGMDHCDFLGDTIEKIAAEKAGIIKNNTPIVVGNLNEKAQKVIKDFAVLKNAEINIVEEPFFRLEHEVLSTIDSTFGSFEFSFNEINEIMAINAQICSEVFKYFPSISFENFKMGLQNFRISTNYRGRMEKLHSTFNWYFDGAHNSEALNYVLKTANTLSSNKKVIVFNCMKDKLTKEFAVIVSQFDEMYYFTVDNQRAATYLDICNLLPAVKPFDIHDEVFTDKDAAVFFTGSFYFYGDIKKRLANLS